MPQTVTIRVFHTAYSIFNFYSYKFSILVANVYVNNREKWLLQGVLLVCNIKLKNSTFSKRFDAALAEFVFHKIQC